jgi:hypothetical protein
MLEKQVINIYITIKTMSSNSETRIQYLMEQIERDRQILAEIDRIMRLPVYDLPDKRRKEKAEAEGSRVLNRIWALRRKIEEEQGIPRSRSQVPDPEPTISLREPRRYLRNPKVVIRNNPGHMQQ